MRFDTDDDTGDPLADDARRAFSALRVPSPAGPDGTAGDAVLGSATVVDGDVRVRARRVPSLVWEAQALGVLLEMGYTASAPCVAGRLRHVARRLDPAFAVRPPGRGDPRPPGMLRTRHVTWVLACLAEVQPPPGPPTGDDAELRTLVATAFRYLAGDHHAGAADDPARWIGPPPAVVPAAPAAGGGNSPGAGDDVGSAHDQGRWCERWAGAPTPNLLNSVYAALGVFRALRHEVGPEALGDRQHVGRLQTPAVRADAFIRRISVGHGGARGPATTIDWDGPEPWATPGGQGRGLPPSVLGLLALCLMERSANLRALGGADAAEAERLWVMAQRIGHELLRRRGEWVRSVDIFAAAGVPTWWTCHSYSICARAVLESGAADPDHEAVLAALGTLAALRVTVEPGDGSGAVFDLWRDPAFGREDALAARAADARGRLHVTAAIVDDDLESMRVTPASMHAAVMALAGYRRALGTLDPRHAYRMVEHPDARHRGQAVLPFAEAVVDDRTLVLRSPNGHYEEAYRISATQRELLTVLAHGPATVEALAADMAAAAARLGGGGARRSALAVGPDSVRNALDRLNDKLGVDLVKHSSARSGGGARGPRAARIPVRVVGGG